MAQTAYDMAGCSGTGTQGAAPAAVSALHQPADVREGLPNVVTTVSVDCNNKS